MPRNDNAPARQARERARGSSPPAAVGPNWWERHTASPRVRRALARLGAFLVGVVAVCWAGVALLGALPGDARSAAEIREEDLGWVALAPARALDWLGRPVPAAVIMAAVGAWLWHRFGWRHAVLLVGGLGASGVTWLIKHAADRSRPEGAILDDPSFPSGHTSWATVVFGLTALFAVQRQRWTAAAGCVVVAAAMGPSRVLLGVHWASDVVAGYAVGLAWLIALVLVGLPWARRDRLPPERPTPVFGNSAGDDASPSD